MLKKTLESSLDCKEIKPVNCKGNQTWIFVGRTDAEAETPILWPPNTKNWLIGKYSDAGKDWRQEEKGTTKDEMVGWHHWLDGHEFEQALGVGDGQGSLACYSHKELDTTEWLNWTEYMNAFPHQKTWSMCVKSLWRLIPQIVFLSPDYSCVYSLAGEFPDIILCICQCMYSLKIYWMCVTEVSQSVIIFNSAVWFGGLYEFLHRNWLHFFQLLHGIP